MKLQTVAEISVYEFSCEDQRPPYRVQSRNDYLAKGLDRLVESGIVRQFARVVGHGSHGVVAKDLPKSICRPVGHIQL